MPESLPNIVIVPGAWHSPFHYQDLMNELEKAGYSTLSGSLPSLEPEDADSLTVTDDADFIRNKLLDPLLSAGKEVVLVMHSYGGSPGGVAANGLSKAERNAKGEDGGIVGMVFIAALLTGQGASLKSAVGGTFAPWVDLDTPKPGHLTATTPIDVFYHDVPTPKAEEAVKALKTMSANALSTPTSTAAAWASLEFDHRRAYIRCADDHCIPHFAQDGMMAGSGVEWDVHHFDTSHSPFLSQPQKLAETIASLATKWMG